MAKTDDGIHGESQRALFVEVLPLLHTVLGTDASEVRRQMAKQWPHLPDRELAYIMHRPSLRGISTHCDYLLHIREHEQLRELARDLGYVYVHDDHMQIPGVGHMLRALGKGLLSLVIAPANVERLKIPPYGVFPDADYRMLEVGLSREEYAGIYETGEALGYSSVVHSLARGELTVVRNISEEDDDGED